MISFKALVTVDIRYSEGWMVWWENEPTSPTFNSKGAAEAYLGLLLSGYRKPEFSSPYPLGD